MTNKRAYAALHFDTEIAALSFVLDSKYSKHIRIREEQYLSDGKRIVYAAYLPIEVFTMRNNSLGEYISTELKAGVKFRVCFS